MAWSISTSSIANNITSTTISTTFAVSQFRRYKWVCPTAGYYQWFADSNPTKDTYGWVSTSSSAYDTSLTSYPRTSAGSVAYNDDSGNGNHFSCAFDAKANTTYYLYASPYSSTTDISTVTVTLTLKKVEWLFANGGDFLSQGTSFSAPVKVRTIHRYTFNPPVTGSYTFEASNLSSDLVGWISDKDDAYNLDSTSNSINFGNIAKDDDSGSGSLFKITATLTKGTTYYLYYSGFSTSTFSSNTTFTLTMTLNSITTSTSGNLIKRSDLETFSDLWDIVCNNRNHYGNVSNVSIPLPSSNDKITATAMNNVINTFNKYFTPAITVVNSGNLIYGSTYDDMIKKVLGNLTCKVACTGSCSTTNSHGSQPATCSSCDTGCSSSCYGQCRDTCYGWCEESCNDGCYGACTYECGGNCNWGCDGYDCHAPSRDCGSYCDSSCGSSCGGGCIYDCWSCDGGCTGSCDDSCDLGCYYECSGDCEGYCDYDCSANCAGNTMGSEGACNESCTHGCATSCSTLCVSSSS